MTKSQRDSLLVVAPSVPIVRHGNGYLIDEKAVAGFEYYVKFWQGPVRAIFREGGRSALPFGKNYLVSSLPFEVCTLPPSAVISDALIKNASVVLASGDNWLDFPVAEQGQRLGVPICYVIEYTLKTRLQIIRLSNLRRVQKAKSAIWTLLKERDRRRAIGLSNGLQCNGVPAANSYGALAPNTLIFFDTRLSERQLATDQEIAAKRSWIEKTGPLRLAFTGRLERLKGADQLMVIAAALDTAGKDFRLDIYGSGSLESEMMASLNKASPSLRAKVRLSRPIDFNRELVPWMRSSVDLFLCCHPQSDPSCTYLETLGCGVPILGYGNDAWRGILDLADVGWVTSTGKSDKIVEAICDLDRNRAGLSKKLRTARDFARAHCFETEFESRVDHLMTVANSTTPRLQSV